MALPMCLVMGSAPLPSALGAENLFESSSEELGLVGDHSSAPGLSPQPIPTVPVRVLPTSAPAHLQAAGFLRWLQALSFLSRPLSWDAGDVPSDEETAAGPCGHRRYSCPCWGCTIPAARLPRRVTAEGTRVEPRRGRCHAEPWGAKGGCELL